MRIIPYTIHSTTATNLFIYRKELEQQNLEIYIKGCETEKNPLCFTELNSFYILKFIKPYVLTHLILCTRNKSNIIPYRVNISFSRDCREFERIEYFSSKKEDSGYQIFNLNFNSIRICKDGDGVHNKYVTQYVKIEIITDIIDLPLGQFYVDFKGYNCSICTKNSFNFSSKNDKINNLMSLFVEKKYDDILKFVEDISPKKNNLAIKQKILTENINIMRNNSFLIEGNGEIYMCGGENCGKYFNDLYILKNNEWKIINHQIRDLRFADICSYLNKIYFVCGRSPEESELLNNIELLIYDCKTANWFKKTIMTGYNLIGHKICIFNNKIVVVGGKILMNNKYYYNGIFTINLSDFSLNFIIKHEDKCMREKHSGDSLEKGVTRAKSLSVTEGLFYTNKTNSPFFTERLNHIILITDNNFSIREYQNCLFVVGGYILNKRQFNFITVFCMEKEEIIKQINYPLHYVNSKTINKNIYSINNCNYKIKDLILHNKNDLCKYCTGKNTELVLNENRPSQISSFLKDNQIIIIISCINNFTEIWIYDLKINQWIFTKKLDNQIYSPSYILSTSSKNVEILKYGGEIDKICEQPKYNGEIKKIIVIKDDYANIKNKISNLINQYVIYTFKEQQDAYNFILKNNLMDNLPFVFYKKEYYLEELRRQLEILFE